MSRKRRRSPTRYEDLTQEEVEAARAEVHRGERARGRSYDDEEPKSWLGRKARSIKQRFKGKDNARGDTKPKGKIREWYDREIKGGLQEAREELGLEDVREARGAAVRGRVKRAKGLAKKIKGGISRAQTFARERTTHMAAGAQGPAFMSMWSAPQGRGRAPSAPHFMTSITRGSTTGVAPNPVTSMGWSGARRSRQPPRKRKATGRGSRMAPGTIIIYAGGAPAPQAPARTAPARRTSRRRTPKRARPRAATPPGPRGWYHPSLWQGGQPGGLGRARKEPLPTGKGYHYIPPRPLVHGRELFNGPENGSRHSVDHFKRPPQEGS